VARHVHGGYGSGALDFRARGIRVVDWCRQSGHFDRYFLLGGEWYLGGRAATMVVLVVWCSLRSIRCLIWVWDQLTLRRRSLRGGLASQCQWTELLSGCWKHPFAILMLVVNSVWWEVLIASICWCAYFALAFV
jgi:hypothetical protein